MRKEITQFRRNKVLPRIIVMMPIMLVLIMPLVTQMDIKNISVVVLDEDRSVLSTRIESHLANSDYFRMPEFAFDYNQAVELMDQGRVDLIVSIPAHFERDMLSGHGKSISLTANAVNATKGGQGIQYATQTIVSAVTEIAAEGGLTANTFQPTDIRIQYRYNPTGNYRHFMLPALMIIVLLLVCTFLPLLNIMTEKEHGTIEQINVTPVSRWEFILAKLIPYWILALVMIGFAMLLAWAVYGLVPAGNPLNIFLGAFLFSLCMSGFSVTIANISNTMQQAIFVLFFFVIQFMLLSGLFTPISSMPTWAQWLTYAFPPRYVINIFRSVYLKGTLLSELWFDYTMLFVLAAVFYTLATITYKKQN
ncbi:MAG: ABC transporter permease [Bacteroidales bacterium]|nr:ABC transporter permease [Bacteroidales bacterium]